MWFDITFRGSKDVCRVKNKILLISFWLTLSMSGLSQNADINILKNINDPDVSSGFYKSMRFVSHSTPGAGLGVPVLVLAAGFIENKRSTKLKAVYMLEALLVNEALTHGLKHVVNRPRPYITYPFIIPKSSGRSSSFPSGHTSLAFAMATSLSVTYPKWYYIAPSFAYAGTVAYSRMYLGVHYPSDVLVGALVGSGSALLTFKINKWMQQSRHKNISVIW